MSTTLPSLLHGHAAINVNMSTCNVYTTILLIQYIYIYFVLLFNYYLSIESNEWPWMHGNATLNQSQPHDAETFLANLMSLKNVLCTPGREDPAAIGEFRTIGRAMAILRHCCHATLDLKRHCTSQTQMSGHPSGL